MRDSAGWLKKLKYFGVMLNIFEFFRVSEIDWSVQISFPELPIIFFDQDSETKLFPASFSSFLWTKIKFGLQSVVILTRGGSRAAATSKMERFAIIVNGWKPLTIITKRSILNVAAALDPPLLTVIIYLYYNETNN